MRTLGKTLTVLVGAGALAAPAGGDSIVAADPSAQNVTVYGSTSAWSRRAPDGTYRLVVSAGGVTADAAVPPSSVAFDPDLGPAGNRRLIVYSRCAAGSATAGCDVYLYDVNVASETKVGAISAAATSEVAPSFFKGNIAFGRLGGKRPGLYLYRPGRAVKRISTKTPAETDLAQTRVVELYHPGGPSGGETFVRLVNYSGVNQLTLARASINGAGEGEKLTSPALSRFNAFWLRVSPLNETTQVQRVGVNAHRGLNVLTATRTLKGEVGSLAVTSIPVLYTNTAGVNSVDPKLAFPTG